MGRSQMTRMYAVIVDADAGEPCSAGHACPWFVEMGPRHPGLLAGNEVGILRLAGDFREDGEGGGREIDRLATGLAIWQQDHATLEMTSLHLAWRISRNRAPVKMSRRIAATA